MRKVWLRGLQLLTVALFYNGTAATAAPRQHQSRIGRSTGHSQLLEHEPLADFHRQIFVFEPLNAAKAIRYVCYENLTTGQFSVSSGEVLTVPQDDETLVFHARVQAEHFITEGVARWFDSLPEAVADFANVMETERG